ncbi:hypothetical protein GIB67_030406 [Kingdonia uniflora]|uniref:Golgin candidate 6 n=1 Tax=Kingdonia uniflora TaxID=39325 RepID=A0A7J7NDU3_9MAGN|nr:hypothetical protein GIB67_030406 [Kingdonia uniflora]
MQVLFILPNKLRSSLLSLLSLLKHVQYFQLEHVPYAEEDFYVRYYMLQVLTALLTHSPNRLQEAILSTPRGITWLMDMLMDREVIRNEASLLLTFLTRETEEIQKIVVFEGAFEKIFNIIKEEGGSEGGVVVQDCLELLNNLLHKSSSNQVCGFCYFTLACTFLPSLCCQGRRQGATGRRRGAQI